MENHSDITPAQRVRTQDAAPGSTRQECLEIWGGVECTVNRVGDAYFDQLEANGHAGRVADLDLFAQLGMATLRYPVLWERSQLSIKGAYDWRWGDERLDRLRNLGIRPIVGLVHHGSGPKDTSLVDPSFAPALAAYAGAVARRFPWVEDYTPVNEPLTTARFSGFYGKWYPHATNVHAFAQALINQCRAIVLAMRAIRAVNSTARLIQTEDLGKVYSTPRLTYQADFENERRWLTWDLLCGRVDTRHALWSFLIEYAGIPERELLWFLDNPCPPEVIGANYYVTSERFLDDRLEHYPTGLHGTNGRDCYADVEAVRVRPEGLMGPGHLISEAWARYRLPLAITEAHLGCTREEQMRWLVEVWVAAQQQRKLGVEVVAVTAWSLLGAYDWDSLLTCWSGHYEPGIFDVRAPAPRATALAAVVRELARGATPSHPVLASPGWWHRPERILFHGPHVKRDAEVRWHWEEPGQPDQQRPLLITGGNGTLAQACARSCRARAISFQVMTRDEMDIASAHSVAAVLRQLQPWAVVNAAGYSDIDDAEREPDLCYRDNTEGPKTLAYQCGALGIKLLTFSSDLVFDGRQKSPYRESDPVNPLSVYGLSKADAERQVLEVLPSALILRTGALFGPWDNRNFLTSALRTLARGGSVPAPDDIVFSPTYVPDFVDAALDLLLDGEAGVWHASTTGAVTLLKLARRVASMMRLDTAGVRRCSAREFCLGARRPAYSVLSSERGVSLPKLDHALERYVHANESAFNRVGI